MVDPPSAQLARTAEVPQPSEPPTPAVPEAPVTPIDPDPGSPAAPEVPATVPTPVEPATPIVPEPHPDPAPTPNPSPTPDPVPTPDPPANAGPETDARLADRRTLHDMVEVVIVLSFAAIPVGALISAARDRSMRRRTRFRLRFAALVTCMLAPWIVALLAAVGEQGFLSLLWTGFLWGLLLTVLAPPLLFHGRGSDSGPSDDGGGGGPGPDDDRPPPDHPLGWIPLPDAEPAATRLRGPGAPRRGGHPRRPAREPERRPSRVSPQQLGRLSGRPLRVAEQPVCEEEVQSCGRHQQQCPSSAAAVGAQNGRQEQQPDSDTDANAGHLPRIPRSKLRQAGACLKLVHDPSRWHFVDRSFG